MRTQLILYGHGSRDHDWLSAFNCLTNEVQAGIHQGWTVRAAFLQFIPPTLEDTVKRAADENTTHIHILPIFLFPGQHVRHDVPQAVQRLQTIYPKIQIQLAMHIGENASFTRLVIESAKRVLATEM